MEQNEEAIEIVAESKGILVRGSLEKSFNWDLTRKFLEMVEGVALPNPQRELWAQKG